MSEMSESYDPSWEFRVLYNALLDYEGTALHAELLAPWLEKNDEARQWLRGFAQRPGSPIPPASPWELQALYAVNRVNDLLLGVFQPAIVDDEPALPISLDEYVAFMTALGFEAVVATAFSPFYHEIVEIAPHESEEAPVEITGSFWPSLMLGNMLFSRAGVRVRSGRRWLRPELAASSTLYWTFRRRNRPCNDLSHGWGGNSQWGTDFRRDYRFGREIYLNADGKRDATHPNSPWREPCPLSPAELKEILIHRCFVTLSNADDDYPYGYSLRCTDDPA